MTTYSEARAVVSEHAALRWRLAALERCSAFFDRGEHAAAIAAYRTAAADPLEYAPLRQLVDELGLLLAEPASAEIQ